VKNKLITVIGTTASGKSSLGIELADFYGGEIISADSRQIYRKMDLGTGKITPEEAARVKHHLIDILDPGEPFSMADFQSLAYDAIDSVLAKGKPAFMVGGTLGNFIDRLAYNGVVDFISLIFGDYYFPIFNLADSFMTVGIILMIIHYFFLDENKVFTKNGNKDD